MVRRQTIEIKSVSLQQSLSKLKQRGVDLVKDSTGLEAGLDCRPGRFAAAQGRQSHPASRPVSSLTRSTPLCFSLARLVLRSPFLFYGLSPDHKKVIFRCSKYSTELEIDIEVIIDDHDHSSLSQKAM